MALIMLGGMGAIGALGYYPLKDWKMFDGRRRIRRIRDVVFGSMLLLFVASFARVLAMGLLHD